MGQSESSDPFSIFPHSYQALCDLLDLHRGLLYTENWSAGADFLQLIVDHCLADKPQVILECSSGLTTLMLARACQLAGCGRVYSLENGEEYASTTQEALDRYNLGQIGRVVHAPLETYCINGREFQWYAPPGLPDKSIDMLVIDGPPGFIQKNSRYPALPLLFDKLSEGCAVYLDDAAREDERETVEFWQAEYPLLEHEYIQTERGCSLLKLKKSG